MEEIDNISNSSKFGVNSTDVFIAVNRDENLAQIELAVLSLLLIGTVMSNSFIIFALIRSALIRPMSRTYFFMFHLSLADLLVGLCNVLPQLCWDVTYRFQGPNLLCKIVKFLQVFPAYLSSLLLMALTFDRYRSISWRNNGSVWSTRRVARMLVYICWATAALFAVPQTLIFSKQEIPNMPGEWDCWASMDPFLEVIYVIFYVSFAFFVPLAVISISFIGIIVKLWRYSRHPRRGHVFFRRRLGKCLCCLQEGATDETETSPSQTSRSAASSLRLGRVPLATNSMKDVDCPLSVAKIKTIKLTMAVVIAFIVCHAPFCGTHLYNVFVPPSSDSAIWLHPMTTILLLLMALPSTANPWIYLCFSTSLLNQLRICCRRGLGRAKENISIGDQEPEDRKRPSGTPKSRSSALRYGRKSTRSENV